ncbi:WhiB family transcriptional regulator [Streptomyces sp. NPDC127038]|uniref:WhiB family transcriptional regulator n=1 Tax=Streptomyces sp. NPDC127038 TaxID=3347114 RepID=UPI0036646DA3
MSHYTGSVPATERPVDWRTEALCAREDMAPYRELFFPLPGETAKAAAAKQICAACPVAAECLADAMRVEGGRGGESRHGIRGGLGPKGRRSRYEQARQSRQPKTEQAEPKPPVKKREPAKCGTRAGYQKHQREKSAICAPCRQANTDADNRLRRTGTSKVAA